MEYLDQLTGEKRAEVYYDVYVKILNKFVNRNFLISKNKY